MTLNLDTGMCRSISSMLVLGIPAFDEADPEKGGVKPPTAGAIDRLSFSSDLGVRSIWFTVGAKRVPEGKAISYHPKDPEMYCLSFRHTDPENINQVPSTYVFDNQLEINTLAIRGWQFAFDLKDALSSYGDGLMSINGTVGVVLSTVPEAPEFLSGAPPTFRTNNAFECFVVTDQVLVISDTGVKWTPVW